MGIINAEARVAIIGAGVAGMIMGIVLHRSGIKFKIYEQRDSRSSTSLTSGILLTPNSLAALDRLGLFGEVAKVSVAWHGMQYVDPHNNILGRFVTGTEEDHGFVARRISRRELSRILKGLLINCAGEDCFSFASEFAHVVKEDETGVTFALMDGSSHRAELLLGCDGIYSAVRKSISDVRPQYLGLVALTATFPASLLRAPSDFHLPVTVQDRLGAYLVTREPGTPPESMLLVQRAHVEMCRAEWETLNKETDTMVDMMSEDRDKIVSDVALSAVDAVRTHGKGVNAWPSYQLPRLSSWTSAGSKVVLLGDAAHATPPSSQQGAGQAIEDCFTLGTIIATIAERSGGKLPSESVIKAWVDIRSKRIEQIRVVARFHELRRMKAENRAELVAKYQEEHADLLSDPKMRWLYSPDLDAVIEKCLLLADSSRTNGVEDL